jgi:hypothetical protein
MRTILIGLFCILLSQTVSNAPRADVPAAPSGLLQFAQNSRGGLQGAITPLPGQGQPQPGPGTQPAPGSTPDAGDQNGDAESLFQTGEDHYYGRGVTQNYTEAVNWYRRAAQFDHVEALYSLGYVYAYGQGVQQDYAEARLWLERAAALNHVNATGELGSIYWNDQNYAEAAYWHRRAADLGLPASMVTIAIALDEGRGTGADYTGAAYYLVEAFVQGSESAQKWLFEDSDQWQVGTRREVQMLLRNAGVYSGTIDGALGPASRSALQAYRRQRGG